MAGISVTGLQVAGSGKLFFGFTLSLILLVLLSFITTRLLKKIIH